MAKWFWTTKLPHEREVEPKLLNDIWRNKSLDYDLEKNKKIKKILIDISKEKMCSLRVRNKW